MNNPAPFDWKKYVIVFFITGAVFATALYISNFSSEQRLNEIQSIEDKISLDILSSETQFNLLAESSCADLTNPSLSEELSTLGDKLAFTENKLGANNTEVIHLKSYYSLLQIKDYILVKKVSEKCKTKPLTILYFYSNAGDCSDCVKTGYVLTYLRNQYPDLRVYSFDYNLDLSALKTLRVITKIEDNLPAIVVNGTPYYGYKSIDDLETLVPELKALRLKAEAAAKTASTTSATSTKSGR